MAHSTPDMAMMEGPPKSLSGGIRWVDHAGDMGEPNNATLMPFLDSEVLDIDMTRTGCRPALDEGALQESQDDRAPGGHRWVRQSPLWLQGAS